MADAAPTSFAADDTSQDPPRILAFIPACNCALQIPRAIANFTPDVQRLGFNQVALLRLIAGGALLARAGAAA